MADREQETIEFWAPSWWEEIDQPIYWWDDVPGIESKWQAPWEEKNGD